MSSNMLSTKDHQRSLLNLAQFKLLNQTNRHFAYKKNTYSIFQELDLNIKVPETNFLKDHDDDGIVGYSLLHLAYAKKNIEMYKILILKGADFNTKDKQGNTVLHKAFHDFCQRYHLMHDVEVSTISKEFIVPTLSAHVEHRNANNTSDPNGLTHFHIACSINDFKAVEFFLNNKVLLNQPVKSVGVQEYFAGYTPLHFAAEFSCVEVTQILLKHGANANLEDAKGQTPLELALEKNIEILDSQSQRDVEMNQQVINLLLDYTINQKLLHLFVASAMTKSYRLERFLSQGVDVNQSISVDSKNRPGYTALHFAAHVNVSTVKLLMKYGANIEAKDTSGVTPLDICVNRYKVEDIVGIINLVPVWKDIIMSDGKTKLVDLLFTFKDLDEISNFLEKSSDNVKLFIPFDSPLWPGFTVLHLAVQFTERKKCKTDYKLQESKTEKVFDPDLSVITKCLQQDADVTMKDHCNWTPIHLAFRLGKRETLNLLLSHHHRIKNCADDQNLSHLHIACAAENYDLVKKLLWNEADVNIVYKGVALNSLYPGWTPLHISVQKRNGSISKLLLQFGADIYIPDTDGFTPIHVLMHCTFIPSNFGKILFSMPNLRDIVIENIGLSYLHVACVVNDIDAVQRLLNLGADVAKVITCSSKDESENYPRIFNYESYDGCTPLHFALAYYHSHREALLKLLIERGADILAKKAENSMSPLCEILESGVGSFINVIYEALKSDVVLQERVERETGITLLHVACCKMDVDLVTELLDNGANVNAQIHETSAFRPKSTALHVLISEDESVLNGEDEEINDLIKLLLERNADVTLTDDNGDTPLHVVYRKLCIYENDFSTLDNVILLLKAQKNLEINPTSPEGFSHFHIACHVLEVSVVETFLEHNIDVNSKTDMFCHSRIAACTPLHLAVKSRRDLNQTDTASPFLKFAKLKIVDHLINHGADVNDEDVLGNTPAHYVGSCSILKENLLQRLANAGADVNARNVKRETPLEMLLNGDDLTLEEVRNFITFGCRFNDYNPVTENGYIALADTVLSHDEMQDLLFGAFVNSPSSMKVDEMKRTAIHNVVSNNKLASDQKGYVELFDIFMTFGCDIDDQDDLGRTALHCAVQFRNELAVMGLLLSGADINITDRSGKTPFAYVFEPCSQCSTDDADHNQYSHTGLFKNFMSQIKKMELCDIYVNQSNEILLNKALERFNFDGIVNKLDEILPELDRIAKIKIEPYSLSLADFVPAAVAVTDYPMMSLVKRRAIDAFFKAKKGSFQKEFKQTVGILELQYRQALLRRKIINTAIESLRVLVRCRLPDICAHIIIKSLKNFELQNLIESTAENQVTNADVVNNG